MTLGHYSRSLDGHRAAYLSFARSRFGGCRIGTKDVLLRRGPVLFLMVEENFGLYVVASLWRALLGRRTAGLLFRPGPAIDGRSWRLRFKRTILRAIRSVSFIQTLSIVPVPLTPKSGAIVDGWIHDFQLWDLSDSERSRFAALQKGKPSTLHDPAFEMHAEARLRADGKRLLIALGMQNLAKGAGLLAASMQAGATKEWKVIVAGRFSSDAGAARETIESCGGAVLDRFLSNDEMLALYAAADAVWCLYDPAYDQASGILGRAIQFGVPPIVRKGSLSETFCITNGIVHGAAEGGADLATALEGVSLSGVRALSNGGLSKRFANESETRLRNALGLIPEQAQ